MTHIQWLQGSWNQLRGQVKEHWGNLTDDDLMVKEGNIDQLIGRIQAKTGEARETIETFLSQATEAGGHVVSRAGHAIGNAAHLASDRLREHYQQLAARATEGADQARGYVRAHPGRSAMMVFGAGLAVGLVVGAAFAGRRS